MLLYQLMQTDTLLSFISINPPVNIQRMLLRCTVVVTYESLPRVRRKRWVHVVAEWKRTHDSRKSDLLHFTFKDVSFPAIQ